MTIATNNGVPIIRSGSIVTTCACCGWSCYAPDAGACCDGTNCRVVQQCDCDTENGEVFKGVGTVCSPNPCLTGRCCLPDGSCLITDLQNCASLGGDFCLGAESCDFSPCLCRFSDNEQYPSAATLSASGLGVSPEPPPLAVNGDDCSLRSNHPDVMQRLIAGFGGISARVTPTSYNPQTGLLSYQSPILISGEYEYKAYFNIQCLNSLPETPKGQYDGRIEVWDRIHYGFVDLSFSPTADVRGGGLLLTSPVLSSVLSGSTNAGRPLVAFSMFWQQAGNYRCSAFFDGNIVETQAVTSYNASPQLQFSFEYDQCNPLP